MNRRRYLQMLAGTGALAGLAGCNSSEDETPTPTERTETPTETPDPTPEPTPTPSDQAPSLVTATTTPQDNGQALHYQIVARDDQGLEYVAVVYGDRKQEWDGEGLGKRVGKSGEFTDLGQPPEDGQVVFVAKDATKQETREERYPDEQAPRLTTLQLQPTANAGEIHARLQGEDNIGLTELGLLLDGEHVHQQNVSGQSETSLNTTVDVSDLATVGEKNDLTARLEDWNANTAQSDSDTYIRKFDVMEDTRLDIGAVYIPFAGDKFGKCFTDEVNVQPVVGQYGDPISPEVTSRHIDQMQGHGITTLQFNFGEEDLDYDRFNAFLESELSEDINFEAFYTMPKPFKRNRDIDKDLEFIRNNMLDKENYNTITGRPIVTFWNSDYVINNEKVYDNITSDYGDIEGFVDHLKNELTVDGTEPFLIADIGAALKRVEWTQNPDLPDKPLLDDFIRQFDGVTTMMARAAEGWDTNPNQEQTYEFIQENWEGARIYTDANDMAFIPNIFPGYDDRENTCWGQDRYTKRGPDFFNNLIEMAEEYTTVDRIQIMTYNDWTEGHQIEPGSFRGEDYGTNYLEAVRGLQKSS